MRFLWCLKRATKKPSKPRHKDYHNLRGYWLRELKQLRAWKVSSRDLRIAQRELARLRKDYT